MGPAAELQSSLRPDEQLLWWGKPDPGVWFARADAFLIPLTILSVGFVVFYEITIANNGPRILQLWTAATIVFGAYLIFGRFIYKRYRKKRTSYGITAQRALIVRSRSRAAAPLWNHPVTVSRGRDSRHASVTFRAAVLGRGRRGGQAPGWYANTGLEPFALNNGLPFAFYDVADADAMLRALDQARSMATWPPLAGAELFAARRC